jgi:aspartyl-tRNA(Asn)/glutamyl-tRNA(Gln) amidotransferase subunit B
MSGGWTPVIGLEVHVQLTAARKLLCPCPVVYDAPPGSVTCPICRALPGTMPVLDGRAVRLAVRAALALGAAVQPESTFDRKHYSYADLPKGFQVTQAVPLARGGAVHARMDGALWALPLTRIHIEEDSARTYAGGIDDNRAGVPLIEVVTAPEAGSPEAAEAFLRALHRTLVAAGVCHGDLERGQLRCDANVSLRSADRMRAGARVEMKNLNSFRFVTRALRHEVARQAAELDAGRPVLPETRGWDGHATYRLRDKGAPYRLLPEPDLPPLRIAQADLRDARAHLPATPLDMHLDALDEARRAGWRSRHGLSDADVRTLSHDPAVGDFFERAVAEGCPPRAAAGWMKSEVLRRINEAEPSLHDALGRLEPRHLAEVQSLLDAGRVNRDGAKRLFTALCVEGGPAEAHARALDLFVVHDPRTLRSLLMAVLHDHPGELARARAGERALHGFFVGRVMRATGRRAEPLVVARLVAEAIHGPDTDADGGSS